MWPAIPTGPVREGLNASMMEIGPLGEASIASIANWPPTLA